VKPMTEYLSLHRLCIQHMHVCKLLKGRQCSTCEVLSSIKGSLDRLAHACLATTPPVVGIVVLTKQSTYKSGRKVNAPRANIVTALTVLIRWR